MVKKVSANMQRGKRWQVWLMVLSATAAPACAPLSQALDSIERGTQAIDRTSQTVEKTVETAERAKGTAEHVKEASGIGQPESLAEEGATPAKTTAAHASGRSSGRPTEEAEAMKAAEAALRAADEAETPEAAEKLVRESIRLHPTADAWNNLGCILRWHGSIDEARDSFQRALHLDPRHEEASENLSRVLGSK